MTIHLQTIVDIKKKTSHIVNPTNCIKIKSEGRKKKVYKQKIIKYSKKYIKNMIKTVNITISIKPII